MANERDHVVGVIEIGPSEHWPAHVTVTDRLARLEADTVATEARLTKMLGDLLGIAQAHATLLDALSRRAAGDVATAEMIAQMSQAMAAQAQLNDALGKRVQEQTNEIAALRAAVETLRAAAGKKAGGN